LTTKPQTIFKILIEESQNVKYLVSLKIICPDYNKELFPA